MEVQNDNNDGRENTSENCFSLRCWDKKKDKATKTEKVNWTASQMQLETLLHSNESPKSYTRKLDKWEESLQLTMRDIWKVCSLLLLTNCITNSVLMHPIKQEIANLRQIQNSNVKQMLILQLDIRESSVFDQYHVAELHIYCLRLLRKFRMRWDSDDKALIREAVIYAFPLLQSETPGVVYEACKFIISLVENNSSEKNIKQKIHLCGANKHKLDQKVPLNQLFYCLLS